MDVKRYGYLLYLSTALLPVFGWWLGQRTGSHDLFAWFTVFYFYAVIPVADLLIGEDRSNPDPDLVERLRDDSWYKFILFLCLPVVTAVLVWGAYIFVTVEFSWWGQLGWIVSIGLVSGTLAINTAHELIHKRSRMQRLAGGYLMALVCYAGFKVEHLRGHHVNVATPRDVSSSRLNQSLYSFLPRAWYHNCVNAWKLEAERLRYKGLPAWHWRNELIWWYLLSTAISCGFAAALGVAGLVFFLLQGFAAFTFLEIVNYLEHYGLSRAQLDDGRFERTTRQHSWNSNYLLTNMLLFQLQRHSDHHENPTREYQLLRHYESSPQLPAGYATMMLLALVPPLWRKVMNPRVAAFYSADQSVNETRPIT